MDRLFLIALEYLPNPRLIIASNRLTLLANITAMYAFNIMIGRGLALTFKQSDVLNANYRSLDSQIAAISESSISRPLVQIFELQTIHISHGLSIQFVLLSPQDKTKTARSEEIQPDFFCQRIA
jgi:hypothetical protein